MHMQNLIKFHKFVKKMLSGNEILTTKGHNHVINFQKLTHNNSKLDQVNVNAYAKFNQIPSICSEDTEHKQNFDKKKEP